jgi:hypothetical protein
MIAIKSANLALRFALELCALAALGVWGFQAGSGLLAKLGLGLGAPLLAAIVWGLFVAPKATVPVPAPVHLLLQIAVFGLAAAGLVAAGHPQLAGVFGVVVVLNMALLYVWRQ